MSVGFVFSNERVGVSNNKRKILTRIEITHMSGSGRRRWWIQMSRCTVLCIAMNIPRGMLNACVAGGDLVNNKSPCKGWIHLSGSPVY